MKGFQFKKGLLSVIMIALIAFNFSFDNLVLGDEVNQNNTNDTYKVVGYYAAWTAYSGFKPEKIDANKLTHINYAFANIGNDLTIKMGYPDIDPSNFKKLNELKKTNPDLKILISVGGWNWSGKFSDVAKTDETRTKFANSAVEFIKKYGLDGIDLDWEYPVGGGLPTNSKSTDDKYNFTLLLEKIREKLDAQGEIDNKHYLLTIAVGSSNYFTNNIEPSKIHNFLDYINIMTYDIHGSWDTYSDFNSPLYNNSDKSPQYKWSIDSSANAWLKSGIPNNKIVIGIPFYGYIFNGVENQNNGIYQRFTNAKAISFKSVTENYLFSKNFMRYYNEESKVPWLFNGSTFISYEDEQSIISKANYVKEKGLGGAMIWELGHDLNMSLLSSVSTVLKSIDVKSVENHWSKQIVNDMVSKQVIKNPDDFNPEGFITRKEFAEYITRALEIHRIGSVVENKFADVNGSYEAIEAINLSAIHGIVNGYPDGTFKPNNLITREEAMTMYSKAMDTAEILETENNRIEDFIDKMEISGWAYRDVKKVLGSEVFNGTSYNTISPLSNLKYAEAAAAINNLLVKMNE